MVGPIGREMVVGAGFGGSYVAGDATGLTTFLHGAIGWCCGKAPSYSHMERGGRVRETRMLHEVPFLCQVVRVMQWSGFGLAGRDRLVGTLDCEPRFPMGAGFRQVLTDLLRNCIIIQLYDRN